jgi:serine O-acetyltransferase
MFRRMVAAVIDDVRTAYRKDPALRGRNAAEVLLYQGLWAVWSHRCAHEMWRRGVPVLPRMMSQTARVLTGIEIHPGATIGRRFFVDHGMGVVIGESAMIGDDVMVYHGVTLGARGWWSDEKGAKRHPTIGDRVVLGSGCSVLGPVTVGDDSHIGSHALVVHDLPAHSTVTAPSNAAHQSTDGGTAPTGALSVPIVNGLIRPAPVLAANGRRVNPSE